MNYTTPEAFKDLLLRYSAITDLIGRRLYPNRAPQSVLADDPETYCVWSVVSDVTPYHLQGASDISEARIQLDIRAREYVKAYAIKEAIKEAVSGFSGEVAGTNGSMTLMGVRLEDARDGYDEDPAAEKGWQMISLDFIFWHSQTVPIMAG